MEGSFLSPDEQKFYSELFNQTDVDNVGKLKIAQAKNVFLASQLPRSSLNEISELCGAERVGHYGRSQFYIALKLIALVQSGHPLPTSLDKLSSGIEIPLPQFGESVPEAEDAAGMEFENPGFIDNAPDSGLNHNQRLNPSGKVVLPPPPQVQRVPGSIVLHNITETDGPATQSMSGSSSPADSPEPYNNHQSPISSPVGTLERNQGLPPVTSTPRNLQGAQRELSSEEGGWADFDQTRSQAIAQNESWAQFPAEHQNHSSSSSRRTSQNEHEEEEEEEDIWSITEEQRSYYQKQFMTLQPDITGVIKGPEAKAFFEKSKLPTLELSKIWQLSDVNKDGTLFLEEFCTAMHLVVLRKHKIDLPDELPPGLIPRIGGEDESGPLPLEAPLPPPAIPLPPSDQAAAVVITPLNSRKHSGRSVTPPSSSGSEVKPSDEDAKIFQPIAVHLAPDGKPLTEATEDDRRRSISDPVKQDTGDDTQNAPLSPTKQRSLTQSCSVEVTPTKIAPPPSTTKLRNKSVGGTDDIHEPIQPPPRSRSRSYTGPTLRSQLRMHHSSTLPPNVLAPHSRSSLDRQEAVKETTPEFEREIISLPSGIIDSGPSHAPTPPPRKLYSHNRAASLDLDKVEQHEKATDSTRAGRPLVPPRPVTQQSQEYRVQSTKSLERGRSLNDARSEQESFADFSLFQASPSKIEEESEDHKGRPQLPPRPCLPDEDNAKETRNKERHRSGEALRVPGDEEILTNTDVEKNKERTRHASAPITVSPQKKKITDRKSIQAAIHAAREENLKLSRFNSELGQELSQMTEERTELEVQLNRLHPFRKPSTS